MVDVLFKRAWGLGDVFGRVRLLAVAIALLSQGLRGRAEPRSGHGGLRGAAVPA